MDKQTLDAIASQTVIVTTTLYRAGSRSDMERAELAKRMFWLAKTSGYKVITVDGGAPDSTRRDFETNGAEVFSGLPDSSLVRDRKHAIRHATGQGYPILAWTEPEKVNYVRHIATTAFPIHSEKADLVVPQRVGMEQYPPTQQLAEPLGKIVWTQLTGKELDMWFGPRTWRRELSDYFLNYNEKYGSLWEGLYVPVMQMVWDGKRVLSVEIDYRHPEEQKRMEEHDVNFSMKRIEQLT